MTFYLPLIYSSVHWIFCKIKTVLQFEIRLKWTTIIISTEICSKRVIDRDKQPQQWSVILVRLLFQYAIDDSLSFMLNIVLGTSASVLGTVAVTCYGIPWFTCVLVPLAAVYYYAQRYCRKTSRWVRVCISKTKSIRKNLLA